jgi:hypothetical protein
MAAAPWSDWFRVLEDGGWRPKKYPVENDMLLIFKHEGMAFVLVFDPNDADYVQMRLPSIWPIESEGERAIVFKHAAAVTASYKLASVHIKDDEVSVFVETMRPRVVDEALLKRLLRTGGEAVKAFAVAMHSSSQKPKNTDEPEPAPA